MTYGYNDDGVRSSMKLEFGTSSKTTIVNSTYTIDALDRTAAISQTANGLTDSATLTFLANGLIDTLVRAGGSGSSGTTAKYTYNNGLLASLTHHAGAVTGTTLTDYSWTYDSNQRVRTKTYTQNTVSGTPLHTLTYDYDANGQLISTNDVPTTGGTPGSGTTTTSSYDANGNSAAAATGGHLGPNNELLDDGTFSYTYDAEGNRLTRTADSGVTGVPAFTQYAYDNRGRMIGVTVYTDAGVHKATQVYYNYDAFDRMVGKTVITYDASNNATSTVSTGFVYDGSQILAEVSESGTTSGNVTRTNLYLSSSGQLLASNVLNADGTTFTTVWPLFDNQGTVRDLYAYNGTAFQIGQSVTFDDFGNATASTPANAAFAAFGIYFATYKLDAATGLYNANARWYDATTHQFTQPDPLGFAAGDPNLYRYVGNAPTNYIDPTGLWKWNELGAFSYSLLIEQPASGLYHLPSNAYQAGRALVTGEAGRALGDRAVRITENATGHAFTGTVSEYASFARNTTGELVGTNKVGEGLGGADLASEQILNGEERVVRAATGVAQVTGTVAGGLQFAGRLAPAAVEFATTALSGSTIIDPLVASANAALNQAASKVVRTAKELFEDELGAVGNPKSLKSLRQELSEAKPTRFRDNIDEQVAAAKPSQRDLADLPKPEAPAVPRAKLLADIAEKLGFKRTNYRSHGQPVYTDGKRFITPDVDSHLGGAFKMADSVDNLGSKRTRLGTYDENLNRIGD